MGDSPKKPLSEMHGLLCADTLRAALRSTRESSLPAREGLKELLTTAKPEAAPASTPQEPSRWDRCLEILVQEFLQKKFELLSLNKARRSQIEEFLRARAKQEVRLEDVVQARVGSVEQEALQLFAYQASVFHLLQILLVKRWSDRGLLPPDALKSTEKTLNWQITTFLKRNSPKGMMARHDWSFLKQNLYSWFSPSKDSWERLRLLTESVNLAEEPGDFLSSLLGVLGNRSRLSLIGFAPSLIDCQAIWRLLIEQRSNDLRLPLFEGVDFTSPTSGAILVSGLRNGESLSALRDLNRSRELVGVWAFTDSDFERYLSEIFLLWDCASEIPQINIHPRSFLKDLNSTGRAAPLFSHDLKLPYQAQLAACFQDPDGKELEDAISLLDQLQENALLLVVSDQFWPTEGSDRSERLREHLLRKSAVRLIIDLRQLTGESGSTVPRSIAIIERCSSKEVRDSNRPHIIRARGHLGAPQAATFWQAVLENIRQESKPGEVNVHSVTSLGEGIRLESMAAAASQQQLRAGPWVTLSDPFFYEASSRIRRTPGKAFALGTLLRWKEGVRLPSPRAVLLREHSRNLLAEIPEENHLPTSDDENKYLFLPEGSVLEHPSFFVSQIYSAPVQFWYRLEIEQASGKTMKQLERQAEQRLKLMPMVRLFEPGSLLPVPNTTVPFASLEDCKRDLTGIFRQSPLGMADRIKLHQIVLALENSVRQNLSLCQEFTKHLFPNFEIERAHLPVSLPEISPQIALDIFRHLDSSPILRHPSIHVSRLRNVHDFKVTNIVYEELPMGGLADLKVFHGIDAVLKLSGPPLLLKAASDEMQKRLGRPWRETADRLLFPTDFMLVQTQVREVLKSIESQLQCTRDYQAVLDQIFCCLFGLSASFAEENVRQAIRRHLSPDEGRIHVKFQNDAPKKTDSVRPTGFLQ